MRLKAAALSSKHFAQLAHMLGPAHSAYTLSEEYTSMTSATPSSSSTTLS